jgi:G3E family GTPase
MKPAARLDTMVTVVDAYNSLAERGLALEEADERNIVDLLIEQVEFANGVMEEDLLFLEALLRRLNPRAEIVRTIQGQMTFPFRRSRSFTRLARGNSRGTSAGNNRLWTLQFCLSTRAAF